MYISGYQAARQVQADSHQSMRIPAQALGELSQGDVIEAKVVSDNGDILTLKTPEGLRFTAKLEGPRVPVGQTIELTVRGASPDGVVLEISKVKGLDAEAFVRSFGVDPERSDVRLVREMSAQQMPLTERNFMAAKQLESVYKALSPEQAVFMLNNKIPVNRQTIAQFQGFLRHQDNLGTKLTELIGLLDEYAASQNETNAPNVQIYEPAAELRDMAGKLFKKIEAGRGLALSKELDAPSLKRELARFLSSLEESSEKMPGGLRQASIRAARELEQSFRFSEQINNFTAYAQLPVNINNRESAAELYVFGDGGETKKIDPRNASMFFSLDTANTGRVEVFAKVTGKDVECDFGLEDPDAAALFRAYMLALSELLDAGGYRLSRASADVREYPSNVLEIARTHPSKAYRFTLDRMV